jgi:hypothetical protein
MKFMLSKASYNVFYFLLWHLWKQVVQICGVHVLNRARARAFWAGSYKLQCPES